MKAWVSEYGTEQRALTPLDFLAYTGKRGMGAVAKAYDFLVEQGVNKDHAQSVADYLNQGRNLKK